MHPWASANERIPRQLDGCSCFIRKLQQTWMTCESWRRQAAAKRLSIVSSFSSRTPVHLEKKSKICKKLFRIILSIVAMINLCILKNDKQLVWVCKLMFCPRALTKNWGQCDTSAPNSTFKLTACGMQILTSICKMNQRSQRLRINTLHLNFLLFCLPHIIGEHGSKVVWNCTQDKSAKKCVQVDYIYTTAYFEINSNNFSRAVFVENSSLQKDWSQRSYFHQVVSCSCGMMLIELRVKLGHAAEIWLQRIFQQNSIKTFSGREISLNKHCFRVLEESSTRFVVWNGACSTVLTFLDATICISVLKGTVRTKIKFCFHHTVCTKPKYVFFNNHPFPWNWNELALIFQASKRMQKHQNM